MEILVTNLKSVLKTDNPKILEALNKKYSYKVPGYQYTPQYKRKVWDGSKAYFKKSGEFRTGLLPRIREDLLKIGVNKNIESCDNPLVSDPFHSDVVDVKLYKYKDYQREAIEHAISQKRCIIDSPTGSGKTIIMAGIVASLAPRKTVVLFKEKGVMKQAYDFFKSCGIKDLGINSGEGYIDGNVMLSTVQSIERIIDTHLDSAEILMVDEVHQFCKGESTVAAIESFPNAIFRYGFTATVPSEKNDIHGRLTLEGAFGPVYITRTASDLISEGSLAKPIIQIVKFEPDVKDEDQDLTYNEVYDKFLVNNDLRNSLIFEICDLISSKNKDSKTLILCKSLDHVEILRKSIPGSLTIEGKDSLEDRYSIINKFVENGGNQVLIGTNVMQTGISINEITHMINARSLEGEIPTIQGLGRGLRKSADKSTLYFYDFYDCGVPYLEQHSKKRIKHYENLNLEINYVKL